jgi:hypothetical protein
VRSGSESEDSLAVARGFVERIYGIPAVGFFDVPVRLDEGMERIAHKLLVCWGNL